MFINFSHITYAHITKGKRSFNVKSSTYYFHMKMKKSANFQICISVPLNTKIQETTSRENTTNFAGNKTSLPMRDTGSQLVQMLENPTI